MSDWNANWSREKLMEFATARGYDMKELDATDPRPDIIEAIREAEEEAGLTTPVNENEVDIDQDYASFVEEFQSLINEGADRIDDAVRDIYQYNANPKHKTKVRDVHARTERAKGLVRQAGMSLMSAQSIMKGLKKDWEKAEKENS